MFPEQDISWSMPSNWQNPFIPVSCKNQLFCVSDGRSIKAEKGRYNSPACTELALDSEFLDGFFLWDFADNKRLI